MNDTIDAQQVARIANRTLFRIDELDDQEFCEIQKAIVWICDQTTGKGDLVLRKDSEGKWIETEVRSFTKRLKRS